MRQTHLRASQYLPSSLNLSRMVQKMLAFLNSSVNLLSCLCKRAWWLAQMLQVEVSFLPTLYNTVCSGNLFGNWTEKEKGGFFFVAAKMAA